MHRWSPRVRWTCLAILIVALWIGANYAALPLLDIYESKVLEAQFHVPANVIRRYESRTANALLERNGQSVSLVYRFLPPNSTTAARAVPLVIYLHGGGECGSDNVRQLQGLPTLLCDETMCQSHPCAVLVPQCPQPGDWSQRLDDDTDLLDAVARIIDEVLADQRIDPNRIYLTGQSMGGFGSWELALRAPERFAAVVPVCGGGDAGRASRLVHVPVWAVHGSDDDLIPVSESQEMISALKSAGGTPRYLELPGVGHNCWSAIYRHDSEILAWMFQQARQTARASAAEP
jgi:predicted peptidase